MTEKEIMDNMAQKERADKIINFRILNKSALKGQILFTGSSLMEQFPIEEICKNHGDKQIVYNRGVGGFRTEDFIENINEMLIDLEPAKVFINIGTNDLHKHEDGTSWQEHLETNYDYIMTQINEKLPDAKIYIMAYYPMNEEHEIAKFFESKIGGVRNNTSIIEANEIAKKLACKHGFEYINVNNGLTENDGNLKMEYTKDGIHMYADAYEIVFNNLRKYIDK